MKNLAKYFVLAILLAAFYSCSDDGPLTVADLSASKISFSNTFASEYLMSEETASNIADRFIWNNPTPVTTMVYDLQASTTPDFTTFNNIATTTSTNQVVLISDLIALAAGLDLDNNPTTTASNGDPNDRGIVYFRVKATIGNGGAGTDDILSEIASMNIRFIETTPSEQCGSLFLVGAGVTDIGWNFPGLELPCVDNIQSVKARLGNGHFRFFESNAGFTPNTSYDYNYYINQGYTIDPLLENTQNGDNFNFTGTPGIYTLTINNTTKTIVLQPSSSLWAVGTAVPGGWTFNTNSVEFIENMPDIWSASLPISNSIFRFFKRFGTYDLNNNFSSYADQGYTIDTNLINDGSPDQNFRFMGTPGTYTLTINAINKTIVLN